MVRNPRSNKRFEIFKQLSNWLPILVVVIWLCTRSKSPIILLNDEAASESVSINSNLTTLPNKLGCICTSTRDNYLRKSSYPCKHRYGLEFDIKHKSLHLILCILLAGDIALNPGPMTTAPHLLPNDAHANSESTRGNITSTRNDSQHGLDCLYLNSRSLKAFVKTDDNCSKVCKIDIFQQLVYCGGYDVVCVCETWLNDCVFDSELLPGYSIFRRDSIGKTGGGVLIAVKDTIRAKRRSDLERNNAELVVVELFKANNQPIFLYTFYHPPSSTTDCIQQLNSSLDDIPEASRIILIGDFNLPAIDWSLDHPNPNNNGGLLKDKFCELVGDHFLEQLITGSTHCDGSKLDLLLFNYPEIINNVTLSTSEQFGFPTDHHIIEFEIQQTISRAKPIKRTIFDYKRGNFQDLRTSILQAGFNIDGLLTEEIDQHWIRWKEWFLTHVNNFIPTKVVRDANSPPWVDQEVRHLLRKKYAALKKYRQSKTTPVNRNSEL